MTPRHHIQHCRNCGHAVEHRIPDDGDTRTRAICPQCHTVHYVNPLNVVGTLPVWEGKVLLCKRNIEPRYGKWTLPAGFMELDETVSQGARRETLEEAGIEVELGPLFSIISVPRVGQVHFFYLAQMQSADTAPGPETQEARLFAEEEIPWDEMAFHTSRKTLQLYFASRKQGQAAGAMPVHDLVIE